MKIAFFIEGNPNNPGGYNQILSSAVCFLCLKIYQSTAKGSANSNQKNSLFTNLEQ